MIDEGQTYKHRARAPRERASSFWSSDWSLTALLWLLIGNIFALPLDRFVPWGRLAARALLSLIIISGVVATARSRRFIAVTATFVLMFLFMGWEGVQRPNTRYLGVFNDLASLLFLGFFTLLILRQVLRAGPITSRRVQGAIAVYLLMGLLWALAYESLELLQPGSFSIKTQHGGTTLSELGYFSFTTLTTLGLGDIVPLSSLARSLTILEGLAGQLFPVILIARLVGMQIEYQQHRE